MHVYTKLYMYIIILHMYMYMYVHVHVAHVHVRTSVSFSSSAPTQTIHHLLHLLVHHSLFQVVSEGSLSGSDVASKADLEST